MKDSEMQLLIMQGAYYFTKILIPVRRIRIPVNAKFIFSPH